MEKILELREVVRGKGVFARQDIAPGELIVEFTGDTFTRDEYLRQVDMDNCHFLQIGEDVFLGPSGKIDDYFNHSCDPNAGVKERRGRIELVAVSDIAPGEEITFDYSTTMDEDFWEMECRCGSPGCRGLVRDFRHLPEPLKRRYLDHGIVLPFIAKKYR